MISGRNSSMTHSRSEHVDPLAWNMGLFTDVYETTNPANVLTDARISFDCPEEETWIPSDQTVHWGKRPNYVYPQCCVMKKDDIPTIPRGSRLVAKLWFCDWTWDEIEKPIGDKQSMRSGTWRSDPGSGGCFEEDKTIVPFERGVAIFRHLRISKEIKLKKTETFTINTLGVEIGYHNPYTKVPFKSLDIYLCKPTKIHIVAHKGSVKLMQKRGLLPPTVNATETIPLSQMSISIAPIVIPHPSITKEDSSPREKEEDTSPAHSSSLEHALTPPIGHYITPPIEHPSTSITDIADHSLKSPNDRQKSEDESTALESNENRFQLIQPSNKRLVVRDDWETLKRMKISQLNEVLNEINVLQTHLDSLKGKISDFMSAQNTAGAKILQKSVRVACNPQQFRPILFIFYAFRIKNLDLAVSLIKAFKFDINEKDPVTGYTLLHVAAKHAFMEGVQWCLQNGAMVNAETALKCTPLHLAYLRNDKRIRQVLKQGKADPNALNCYGLKPKDYHNNRKPLERLFPETTYSVEVVIDGFDRPFFLEIWFAARIGWLEVVKIYIEQLGCDVDVKNTNGQTPLMCACEHSHLETVSFLLKMGADPNARDIHDSTPLHYSYMTYGVSEITNEIMEKIIEMLEKEGADPNLKNIWGRNPEWYKHKNIESPWKWSF